MSTSKHNFRRLVHGAAVAFVVSALSLSASPAEASTDERRAESEATGTSHAMSLLADSLESLQFWLRTGVVVPPQMMRSARQSSSDATTDPEHNNPVPDLGWQVRGYDWDSAGNNGSD